MEEAPLLQHREESISTPKASILFPSTTYGDSRIDDLGYGSQTLPTKTERGFSSDLSDKSFHIVEISSSDSDEEELDEPPSRNLIYHRSWKDKLKLIVLPPLYFVFMVTAAVVAFFTIEALVFSYNHKVQSVEYITVDKYSSIGIAIFPEDFATYDYCTFVYPDNLNETEACTYTNVTFFSQLRRHNTTAMVFNGPTLVHRKQCLAIHFTVDTTMHNYSSMDYLLLAHWEKMIKNPTKVQANYLAEMEESMPVFTLPAGFKTWVKMSYTVQNTGKGSRNRSNFDVQTDLSAYNDWRNTSERTSNPILALFKWKGDTYEYVTEILSTNAWNSIGALAGVFVTLIKVGEYANRWIKRIRREKKKKFIKMAEIEEEHRKKLDQYWQNKMKRKLRKLDQTA